MSKPKLVATVLFSIVALITAGAGLKFIFAAEYFSYHAAVSGVSWSGLESGLQLLVLSGFKIVGAGFLTVALCLGLMIVYPFIKYDQAWSYYAIPISGLVFWSIILTTTLGLSFKTEVVTPWLESLFCVSSLLLGCLVLFFGSGSKTNAFGEY